VRRIASCSGSPAKNFRKALQPRRADRAVGPVHPLAKASDVRGFSATSASKAMLLVLTLTCFVRLADSPDRGAGGSAAEREFDVGLATPKRRKSSYVAPLLALHSKNARLSPARFAMSGWWHRSVHMSRSPACWLLLAWLVAGGAMDPPANATGREFDSRQGRQRASTRRSRNFVGRAALPRGFALLAHAARRDTARS